MTSNDKKPQLGAYRGVTKDFTCPGDHVTWEILLLGEGECALECIPEMNYFQGGQPPWRCEGKWTFDEDDMEIEVTITKPDAIGPRKDQDITIPVNEDGSLSFKKTTCVWKEGAPVPNASKLKKMTIKDLKAALLQVGIDPVGCVERADFEAKLLRAGPSALPPDAPPNDATEAAAATTEVNSASDANAAAPTQEASATASAASPTKPAPAEPAPAAAPAESAPAVEEDEGLCYSLEELSDKRAWEKLDVVSTEREKYLPNKVFKELFGMSKDDFAKQPKWKKDNQKKKHGLF